MGQIATVFELELKPAMSFKGTEVWPQVFLDSLGFYSNDHSELIPLDPTYSLMSPLEAPSFEAPHYDHISEDILNIIQIVSVSLKGLYSAELIVAIAFQSVL